MDPNALEPTYAVLADGRAKLARKKIAVMAAVAAIKKKGTLKTDKLSYKFAKDSDVLIAVRRAMIDAGLAFSASILTYDRKGDKTQITLQFAFTDVETGHQETALWAGEADDRGDKGIGKAATLAEKYFLLKYFMVPTEENDRNDPDGIAPEEPRRQTARPAVVSQPVVNATPATEPAKPSPALAIRKGYKMTEEQEAALVSGVKEHGRGVKYNAWIVEQHATGAASYEDLVARLDLLARPIPPPSYADFNPDGFKPLPAYGFKFRQWPNKANYGRDRSDAQAKQLTASLERWEIPASDAEAFAQTTLAAFGVPPSAWVTSYGHMILLDFLRDADDEQADQAKAAIETKETAE